MRQCQIKVERYEKTLFKVDQRIAEFLKNNQEQPDDAAKNEKLDN